MGPTCSKLWLLACGLAAFAMASAWADDDVTVDSLDFGNGISALTVRGADGQVRQVGQGGTLREGDGFETGPDGAVNLIFKNEGAQVLVGKGAAVTVRSDEKAIELREGEVRALVDHELDVRSAEHRFVVRTPSAVFGVRGTDFVVSQTAGASEVHTVDGTVDAARDATALRAGRGVAVPKGLMTAVGSHGVEKARAYSMGEYLKGFNARHPRLQRLFKRATLHRLRRAQQAVHRGQQLRQQQRKQDQRNQRKLRRQRKRRKERKER